MALLQGDSYTIQASNSELIGQGEAGKPNVPIEYAMDHAVDNLTIEALQRAVNIARPPGASLTDYFLSQVPSSTTPEPSLPVAVALPEHADRPDAEYLRVAQKIGFKNLAILEAQLAQVLREECIHVYDYATVAAYLDAQCRRRDAEGRIDFHRSYRWIPMRQADCATSFASAYLQAVPLPVLCTAEKILDRMPEAKFFISQIVDYPDPFLAVTVVGSSKLYVIERWDEPTFRE